MLSFIVSKTRKNLYLIVLISIATIFTIGAFCTPSKAFADMSIKYGWMALDANKKPVLQGSQYTLSGKVCPVAYISNGTTVKAVNSKSVVYLNNTKTGRAQALIIGSNIIGCKDAFITTFTIVNKSATTNTNKSAITDIAKASVGKIQDRYADGLTKVTPAVVVKLNGSTLTKGKDYTVYYINSKDKKVTPKAPGTYTAVIKGAGKYTGTVKSAKFKLVNIGNDLARVACELSHSKGKYSNKSLTGTAAYLKAWKAVGKPNKSTGGRGCDAGMSTIIRYSGYDKKYPGGLGDQFKWLGYRGGKAKSDRWVCLGSYEKVKSELLPGDIIIRGGNPGHTCMYVSKKIAQDVYNKKLKGTKADSGKTTGSWVSAHHSINQAPSIGSAGNAGVNSHTSDYKAYRCVKPAKSKYRAGEVVK